MPHRDYSWGERLRLSKQFLHEAAAERDTAKAVRYSWIQSDSRRPMQDDDFEWDDDKARSNFQKHGVTFGEAATVFVDELAVVFPDPDHSLDEDRYLVIGVSATGRTLIVSHTDRENRIRIISAREANRREQKGYEDGTFP
jgi:uncharacterized DUF497 family protein